MAVYVLSVRAIVKPIKVIGDCLISMMFLKSVSGLCSKFSAGLSLRGAARVAMWIWIRELDLSHDLPEEMGITESWNVSSWKGPVRIND